MQCPKCFKQIDESIQVCECGAVMGNETMQDNASRETYNGPIIIKGNNRWQSFIKPLLVGVLLINAIPVALFIATKNTMLLFVFQSVGVIVAGLAMGYITKDIPIMATILLWSQSFLMRLIEICKPPVVVPEMIGVFLAVSLYFAMLYGSTYVSAKYAKKAKPIMIY